MTMIKFNYNDSYGQPSRGSLAFMPHRRHAANETEVLPKPFTMPLLNGETTVNLQPNSSSWVWIITEYFENKAQSFYTTIPDRDGIIEHTELVHISPSSIPAAYDAVEPAWWAEMRQFKNVVSETLLKSGDALTEAQQAIATGKESVSATASNASLAKSYFEQSRDYSYQAKDYRDEAKTWRDEAQEQADRAATGPESAAARSEHAATRSETARDLTEDYRDQAQTAAQSATNSATTATNQANTAVTKATEAQAEANRATQEANRAQGYADDLLTGPRDHAQAAEAARDAAQNYRDQAQTYATNATTQASEAQSWAELAEAQAQDAQQASNDAQGAQASVIAALSDLEDQTSEWIQPTTYGDFGVHDTTPLRYRFTPYGVQLNGSFRIDEVTEHTRKPIIKIDMDRAPHPMMISRIVSIPFPYTNVPVYLQMNANGELIILYMPSSSTAQTLTVNDIILPYDN